MASVELLIGGRRYPVTCRDGEEADLLRAAAMVDGKVAQAAASLGGMSEVRGLLLAALLLADEAADARAAVADAQFAAAEARAATEAARAAPPAPDLSPELHAVAERLEAVATLLAGPAEDA